jgi:hypothetical protein
MNEEFWEFNWKIINVKQKLPYSEIHRNFSVGLYMSAVRDSLQSLSPGMKILYNEAQNYTCIISAYKSLEQGETAEQLMPRSIIPLT